MSATAGGGGASAVSVLAPNGRRVTVRVGPSTALIQILEEVCRKQNFSPNEFDLKFQRTVLDPSLQWRFANLPNNAKLEMVPISRNRVGIETTIRIALQLDDGSRLQDTFSSNQTLWDVLHHFSQTREYVEQQSEISPVCVYMRDEVSGKTALEKTSLKSIGLTGGNAIIRVIAKKSISSDYAEDGSSETFSEEITQNPCCREESVTHKLTFPISSASTSETAYDNQCTDKQKWNKGSQDGRVEFYSPSEPMPTSFVPFVGSGQCCATPVLSPVLSNQPTSLSSPGGPSKPKKSKNSQGKLKAQKEHLEREPIVCHPDLQEPLDSGSQDLPDEFFEVTVDDVRKRLAQLQNERRSLEEAPLMTKAQRESQMKEKIERYPKVVLRVYFPDRYILQGFFHPNETVGALRAFVKSHLADPETPFYLFITPPRFILGDDGTTLFQNTMSGIPQHIIGSEDLLLETTESPLEYMVQGGGSSWSGDKYHFQILQNGGAGSVFMGTHTNVTQLPDLEKTSEKTSKICAGNQRAKANLFPTAIVYFGSEMRSDHYLRLDLQESAVSPSDADILVARWLSKSVTHPVQHLEPAPYSSPMSNQANRNTEAEHSESTTLEVPQPQIRRAPPGKVPKWLKLPGGKR